MRGRGLISTSSSARHTIEKEVHGYQAWRDSLAAAAVALIGIGMLLFVLIVPPSIVSI